MIQKYLYFILLYAVMVTVAQWHDYEFIDNMVEIVNNFTKGAEMLNDQNISIENNDLLHTNLTTLFPNMTINYRDDEHGLKFVKIKCDFTKFLELELSLPNYVFYCSNNTSWYIPVEDIKINVIDYLNGTLREPRVSNITVKKLRWILEKKSLNCSNYTLLRKQINSTIGDIVTQKLKLDEKNKVWSSMLKFCSKPETYFHEKENMGKKVAYYFIRNITEEKSHNFDLHVEQIRIENLWNFGLLSLNHNKTSAQTNFFLEHKNLLGNVSWKYKVHAGEPENDVISNSIQSTFDIDMLNIEGYRNASNRSEQPLHIVIKDLKFQDLCKKIFQPLLSNQVMKIIDEKLNFWYSSFP